MVRACVGAGRDMGPSLASDGMSCLLLWRRRCGPWQVESARALAASAPSNNHPCARARPPPPPPTKTQPQFRRGQCEGRIYRVACKFCECVKRQVSLDCASQGCHEAETERPPPQSLNPSAGRTASRLSLARREASFSLCFCLSCASFAPRRRAVPVSSRVAIRACRSGLPGGGQWRAS